jgi:hypothetical protein
MNEIGEALKKNGCHDFAQFVENSIAPQQQPSNLSYLWFFV